MTIPQTFERYARQSRDIQHVATGPVRFARLQPAELGASLMDKLDGSHWCLVLWEEDLEGTIADRAQTEQFKNETQTGFEILRAVEAGNPQARELTQNEAYAVGLKIWRRMLYEHRKKTGFFAGGARLSPVNHYPVSGGGDNLCGWAFRFTLTEPIAGVDGTYDVETDFDTTL